MASRGGVRAAGTDGSDFKHRERVAPHYNFGKWPFPRASLWEYLWCFGSLPAIVFGYLSLNRNRLFLMRMTLAGIALFGLLPVICGSLNHATDLLSYYYTRTTKYNLNGFPYVVLVYIFLSICIQVHGFSLYFGLMLTNNWSHNSKKHQ